MNITEDYCSFEVAKLLKEKGYCNISNTLYKENGEFVYYDVGLNNMGLSTTLGDFYEAPTHQTILKWLREVHNIFIQVDYIWSSKELYMYTFDIHNMKSARSISSTPYGESFNSYEEAVEETLKYCLTNLI